MDVCVIGGGPAGMMSAIIAARNGAKVTLIEKNEKLGKKLFLTGKGRCNLTNSCLMEELFASVVRNPKFMYSSFYDFTNSDTIDFFENIGLKVKTERGNRVFPNSDHSSDVIKVLANELNNLAVDVRLFTTFVDFIENNNKISSVILSDQNGNIEKFKTDAIIMATGGVSYSSTGSDGNTFPTLKNHNINVENTSASLIPFVCKADYITSLQGISLKNVSFRVKVSGKEKYNGFGEMLFTHFGVSGPLVLSASAYISEKDFNCPVEGIIDLKPALTEEELDLRILRDFSENNNKQISNIIPKLVPSKMTDSILYLAGIDGCKKVNCITKEERRNLCSILKNFSFDISDVRPVNEAIITRGGVSVKDINPKTMESKKIKGLYFAGEMIDVDALTGGFNLQIAWSTGHLAGEQAACND